MNDIIIVGEYNLVTQYQLDNLMLLEKEIRMTPFIKWAGGKRQLLGRINELLPNSFNNYYEPFIGGGAVLFNIRPTNSFINDINKALINTYIQIRDNHIELINLLKVLDKKVALYQKEFYYEARIEYNKLLKNNIYSVETAAYFIFLNKHGFNGLYRVNKKGEFKRTSNRHDYAISPSGITALNILKDNNYEVRCVGKINDIFNGCGVTSTVHTTSNNDGMDKTLNICLDHSFNSGLCFVNLVEFDSEYGHRRNVIGYGKAIEEFDEKLNILLESLRDDDLLMITADHGNDPTWKGTDHTREKVPLLVYSKMIKDGRYLGERDSFADIGDTILTNFNLKKHPTMIGRTIEEILK